MTPTRPSSGRLWEPEPAGASPLDPDDAGGLLPDHIATRAELNAWEQANIAKAFDWLARRPGASVLSLAFVRELHRRMFDETWTWAGEYRTKETNIGVPPHEIAPALQNLLTDVAYWVEHATYPTDEIAARFHHRIVLIHPFPNGNGRHGRLMADALVVELGGPPFTWGSGDLVREGDVRARYLKSMRQADAGDYGPLFRFVRSGGERGS
jgi:Fic-DOC domain mobile mystery protein B